MKSCMRLSGFAEGRGISVLAEEFNKSKPFCSSLVYTGVCKMALKIVSAQGWGMAQQVKCLLKTQELRFNPSIHIKGRRGCVYLIAPAMVNVGRGRPWKLSERPSLPNW